MSHFCVAVITKRKPTEKLIEDMLAKYSENITVDKYISETPEQFLKKKREDLQDYKDNGYYAEWLKDPEKYERECRNPGHIEYLHNFMNVFNMTDKELLEERRNLYSSSDEENSCNWIDGDDNMWSTYNPLSKWDWYEIGGRWRDCIPLKSGGNTNCTMIKNIDFCIDIDYEKERRNWADESYEKLLMDGDGFRKGSYFRKFYPTVEDYIRDEKMFSTFAVLDAEGNWYEKGSMGWFGCSSETPEEANNWNKSYYDAFFKDIDQEWYMTIVDCHI